MEIEAKYAVPDETMYDRLRACQDLAGFALAPRPAQDLVDHYYDTADRRFLSAGYVCRLRDDGQSILVTLKSLGGSQGAVHRRDEREVRLDHAELDPRAWPAGPAADLARQIAAGQPLAPLLELHQVRERRMVQEGEREVAEMTLDRVEAQGEGGSRAYYELEIELRDGGRDEDLQRLTDELEENWQLDPEPRSKFERALAGLSQPPGSGARLADDERALLERFSTAAAPLIRRRALAVLAWGEGRPVREISAAAGLSMGRARYWVAAFRKQRMSIFRRALAAVPPGEKTRSTQTRSAETGPRAGKGLQGAVKGSDGAGQPVAAGQPDAPAPAAPAKPDKKRKEQAPAAPAPQPEPKAAAAPAEPAAKIAPLPGSEPDVAEAYAKAGAAKPEPVAADDPMAEAGRKLLRQHYQKMLDNEDGTRAGEDIEALHDMRVATRRMRAAYRLFEPFYDGKAVERLNKGLKLTGRYLGAVRDLDVLIKKAEDYAAARPAGQDAGLAPLLADWRERRAVARRELTAYLDSNKYRKFRERMAEFVSTPGLGAAAADEDNPVPDEVRYVAPGLLLERYAAVRAYERLLPNTPLTTYHELRIACKWLRYALEFFRDILGQPAGALIKQVTGMQDLLGDLHDATVAEGLVADFLSVQVQRHTIEQLHAPPAGALEYLAAQWRIQAELLARFPEQWAALSGYDFRRGLNLALAAL